jgi:hypothetical protein
LGVERYQAFGVHEDKPAFAGARQRVFLLRDSIQGLPL